MKVKNIVTIALLLLATAVVMDAKAETTLTPVKTKVYQDVETIMSKTCDNLYRYHRMDYCEGLYPPRVVYAIDLKHGGRPARGLYFQGVIYINNTIPNGVLKDSILVHEMVHYILDYSGYATGLSASAQCESERVAFAMAHRFLRIRGAEEYIMPNWRKYYPQCQDLTTRPQLCYHLYNTGQPDLWRTCMGVGRQ